MNADKPKKQLLRYSGGKSKEFWKRINSISRSEGHELLYIMGCALQDLEGRMIHALEAAEKRGKSR